MKQTANKIITLSIFNEIMNNLGVFYKGCEIAVAVSGGSDSMALAHLANSWAKENKFNLTIIIVNHNIREDSQIEANRVSNYFTKNGIKNIILIRKKIDLTSKIQESARIDRYNILLNYCYENNIAYLLVGHHLDDQLETLCLREQKGENQLGLSAMSAQQVYPQAIILRPLLNFDKKTLLNTLKTFDDFWVEDPSNANDKYARVQVRNKLNKLTDENKTELKLKLANHQQNRLSLENELIKAMIASVKINKMGLIKINLILFINYEERLQILLLRYLLKYATGNLYSSEIGKIRNLLANAWYDLFVNKVSLHKFSVSGTIVSVKSNYIKIFKEPNATTSSFSSCCNLTIWDGRFIAQSNYDKLKKTDLETILQNKEFKKEFKKYDINMQDVFALPWKYSNEKLDLKSNLDYKYLIKYSLLMNRFNIL